MKKNANINFIMENFLIIKNIKKYILQIKKVKTQEKFQKE